MLEVEANFELVSLNTLKLECIAECYVHVSTTVELQEALSEARLRSANINVLGGGSNLILNRYLPGMTIHMGLKGRELLEESVDDVVVRSRRARNGMRRYFGQILKVTLGLKISRLYQAVWAQHPSRILGLTVLKLLR